MRRLNVDILPDLMRFLKLDLRLVTKLHTSERSNSSIRGDSGVTRPPPHAHTKYAYPLHGAAANRPMPHYTLVKVYTALCRTTPAATINLLCFPILFHLSPRLLFIHVCQQLT